jgi:hypothetical protein
VRKSVYHYSKNLKLFRDAVSIILLSSYMFQGFAVRDVMTTSSISYTVYPSPGYQGSECEAECFTKKLDLIAKKKKIQAGRNRSLESVVEGKFCRR